MNTLKLLFNNRLKGGKLTAHLQSYLDHLNDESFHLKCHCIRLFVSHRMNVFLSLEHVVPSSKYHLCLESRSLYQRWLSQPQLVPMVKCLLSSSYHFDFDFQNCSSKLLPKMTDCWDDTLATRLAHDLVYKVDFCTSVQIGKATPNMYDRIQSFRFSLCTCCIKRYQTYRKTHAVPVLSEENSSRKRNNEKNCR